MNIKINNNNYKIILVDKCDDNLLMDDDRHHCGVTDFIHKKIYISNGMENDDSFRTTLIHEITHAVIDSYGFSQIEWNDEVVCDFVSNYIYNISSILDEFVNKNCKKGITKEEIQEFFEKKKNSN